MVTVKEKYGFLPTSVWHIRKEGNLRLFMKDNHIDRTSKRTDKSFLPNLKLSEFNPNVAKRIIKYWSKEKDLIFDPFAGRATRGFVAKSLGRYYIGCEVSPTTYETTKGKFNELGNSQKFLGIIDDKQKFVLLNQDGCDYHEEIEDNEVDLVFTCPPYWNLEKYESCKGQLSDCKTYDEFMNKLYDCIQESHRVLKDNKFAIWVVADFRKNGYHNFHSDIINAHISCGFELWDIVINVIDSPFACFKAGFNDNQKYTAKSHEYILVFKKINRFDVGENTLTPSPLRSSGNLIHVNELRSESPLRKDSPLHPKTASQSCH